MNGQENLEKILQGRDKIFQELVGCAIAGSIPVLEGEFGLEVAELPEGTKPEIIGWASSWLIREDSLDKRRDALVEIHDEIRRQISEEYPDKKLVKGSLNVFHDPHVHRSGKYGFYGWVEVF